MAWMLHVLTDNPVALYSSAWFSCIQHRRCKCQGALMRTAPWSTMERFSASLNVSLRWNFPFLSPPPLCPYCDTAVLPSSLFLKNKVKKIGIKGGVFCAACRRVSPQVSTWNTKVFSYLICIHSHNEWAWLSCFQVRRVQTRLLFALSSDMCMLLPPVQALERSHRLCPGCTPPPPPYFPFLCVSVYVLRNHFR